MYLVGIVHANLTVGLEITGKSANRGATITCTDPITEKLQSSLLDFLNEHIQAVVPESSCKFLRANSTICNPDLITFRIRLVCAGGAPIGNLADNVNSQEKQIEMIMARKSSQSFKARGVEIIVRLFRLSDRAIPPKETCSDECSEKQQASITLCDCPCKLTITSVK